MPQRAQRSSLEALHDMKIVSVGPLRLHIVFLISQRNSGGGGGNYFATSAVSVSHLVSHKKISGS